MNGHLLDTNIVSELVSIQPNPKVLHWLAAAEESRLFLSVITLGEIRQGVAALPVSRKRTRLEQWLDEDLRVRFSGRVLPVDANIADRWGWLTAQARLAGRSLPVLDALIAATALERNLVLVTRNQSDFDVPGLATLNPWEV